MASTDAVVALSSLYETADSLIELARQRVFRNNKTRNCHVLCTDLYKCFLKLFTRILFRRRASNEEKKKTCCSCDSFYAKSIIGMIIKN